MADYVVVDAGVMKRYVQAVNGLLAHLDLDENSVADALLYTAAAHDLIEAVGA